MNLLSSIDTKAGDHLRNPYSPGFEPVTIPEGTSGDWEVKRYEVGSREVGLFNLRLIRDGMYRRIVPPGTYTRLSCGNKVVMTDTPAESHEHARLVRRAIGRILINGLGLGFGLKAMLKKPEVEAVIVVEKSADVLNLVSPHIPDPRVSYIHADALEWRPAKGERFDVVWHDIWPDCVNGDDKPEISKLRRAYGRRTEWQGVWSEEYMR